METNLLPGFEGVAPAVAVVQEFNQLLGSTCSDLLAVNIPDVLSDPLSGTTILWRGQHM